jgi:hypothetical protein
MIPLTLNSYFLTKVSIIRVTVPGVAKAGGGSRPLPQIVVTCRDFAEER